LNSYYRLAGIRFRIQDQNASLARGSRIHHREFFSQRASDARQHQVVTTAGDSLSRGHVCRYPINGAWNSAQKFRFNVVQGQIVMNNEYTPAHLNPAL
jgi:hypothetical protein